MLEKILNYPPINPNVISELAQSVEKFIVLATAVELNLFDHFKKPKSAEEVAKELKLNKRLTKKVCNALAASGFLKEVNGKYALTEVSKVFLLSDSPFYQGNLIKLYKKTREERWNRLGEALRKCPLSFRRDQSVFNESFILAMAEGAVRWDLPRTVEIVKELPEFKRARKLLDLGGGHGLYALAFKEINPELDAYVFDLPPVIEVAKKFVGDRVKLIAGDFTKDDIGSGYDIVFASDVFYRPREELTQILKKVHESLNDDGILISKHWHIDDLKEDSTAVFFDLMFAILEEVDSVYSTPEFCDILESCRFEVVDIIDIGKSYSPSKIIVVAKRG
ncbi:class I SAM-dependent methyltransferase [Archaeoglobus profundus]|uniref:Methyltransferase type 12 n=1 Tax=Archaeoglobus profundus (strain DSM 5631 / JCM 9629 / NBRC 100127 / Av18) TaxID=572546 RepID=D2RD83_ARCPA|nr:class I SAM-dependent methyltransferase [Archaeoglobus profundus]ADB58077.1 Methyltransferase type 12 [Archaeoglobus profundus DSM 5631]